MATTRLHAGTGVATRRAASGTPLPPLDGGPVQEDRRARPDGETLTFELDVMPQWLYMAGMAESLGRDEEFGAAKLQLDVLDTQVDTWLQLYDYKQMPTGEIHIRLRWDARKKRRSRMRVVVLEARNLRAADSHGTYRMAYVSIRLHTSTQRTQAMAGSDPLWQRRVGKPPPCSASTGVIPVPVLYDAAARGDIEEVRQQIAAGADLNEQPKGRNGNTALHRAAANGHHAVVKELLKHGADPEMKTTKPEDDAGWTAFHCACHSGHRGKLSCPHGPSSRTAFSSARDQPRWSNKMLPP